MREQEKGIVQKIKSIVKEAISREAILTEVSQKEARLLSQNNSNRGVLCISHLVAFVGVFLLLLAFCPASSAINEAFTVQGRITDDNNVVVNDSVDLNFTIYDTVSGGNELWHEYHFGGNQISVVNGLFNVVIGDINTDKSLIDIDFNSARWLEIAVDGEVQSPRIKLNSVASAVIAEKANVVPGSIPDSNFMTFGDFNSWYASAFNPIFSGDSNFSNVGLSKNAYIDGNVYVVGLTSDGGDIQFSTNFNQTRLPDGIPRLVRYNEGAPGAVYIVRRARGTKAVPNFLNNEDTIFTFNAQVWVNGALETREGFSGTVGQFGYFANENHDAGSQGTKFAIKVIENETTIGLKTVIEADSDLVNIDANFNVTGDSNFTNIGISSNIYGLGTIIGTNFKNLNTTASGTNATALGSGTRAIGNQSFAMGFNNSKVLEASGAGSTAIGYASGNKAGLEAMGIGSFVYGKADSAINGGWIRASGSGSSAGGYAFEDVGADTNITASGKGSIARGYAFSVGGALDITASGDGSIAMGRVAGGIGTTSLLASGIGSIAMGNSQDSVLGATNIGSIAMGSVSGVGRSFTSSGIGSVAMGYSDNNTIAQGKASIALGYNVKSLAALIQMLTGFVSQAIPVK